jgi:hypothetical protein
MYEFDLDAAIKDALEGDEPDPHVIAADVARYIPDEALRDIVATLLVDRVRLYVRHARPVSLPTPSIGALPEGAPASAGLSRWAAHARYTTATGWKFYEDLTADDCDFIASEYEIRAAQNLGHAERFRALAERLRAAHVARIADLAVAVPA